MVVLIGKCEGRSVICSWQIQQQIFASLLPWQVRRLGHETSEMLQFVC